MKEWTSAYNPFNSMKALTQADRFEAILEGKPKAPLVVNMDLTNACNYNCTFCMFGGNRERADKSSQEFRKGNATLPKGYAPTLPSLWKEWGVKAVCLAGGGEPTLHPDCREFIRECKANGLELGLVSNGLLITSEWWTQLARDCKFVGFSVDAGTSDDYARTKGVFGKNFYAVLNNMRGLADTRDRINSRMRIGYKFVLDQNNWQNIYQAVRVAKEAGANDFQFRPAIEPNPGYFKDKLENIWEQIERARELETSDFRIYGIQHKFNPDLTKKHDFKKCRATQLTSTWCADGKVYMCTDTRGCEWSYLTDHYPEPRKVIEYWGSKEHQEKVDKIDFKRNCDRCTLAPYNEMFEQVFMEDKMMRHLI